MIAGCKKSSNPVIEKDGQVKLMRLVFSPGYETAMFDILIDGKYYIPEPALAAEFKVDNLNVHIRYKRAASSLEFPVSSDEIIEIIAISKR